MTPDLVVGIGLALRPILQPQPALAAAAAIYKPFFHFLKIGKMLLSALFANRGNFSFLQNLKIGKFFPDTSFLPAIFTIKRDLKSLGEDTSHIGSVAKSQIILSPLF